MRPRVWRFRFAETAARHAEEIAEWWAENRPLAPGMFAAELDQCLARLAILPRLGTLYRRTAIPGVRRILLRATRYHVYYSVDEAAGCIWIRAIWHAARGARPELG